MKMKLDKPIYLGMSILDLSKVHMYSFYYDVLKAKYKDDVRLIYTDTDSHVIETFTEDIYEDWLDTSWRPNTHQSKIDDWKGIKDYMDFSASDKKHPNYDPTNKKVLGKFKDEMDGKIRTNFIALRPKLYCLKTLDEAK